MEERARFESKLARRIGGSRGRPGWTVYSGVIATLLLLLALNASSVAAPHTVIKIGSQTSVAKYLGTFEGKSQVLMLGIGSPEDWVCIKIPFKGRLSELKSISFSDSILQTTDNSLEPYVVLKLSENRFLASHPHYSYSTTVGTMPFGEWQFRDLVSEGKWAVAEAGVQSLIVPLSSWINMIGDRYVVGIGLYIGPWQISGTFQCNVGDITVNGAPIEISNAARVTGTLDDLTLS